MNAHVIALKIGCLIEYAFACLRSSIAITSFVVFVSSTLQLGILPSAQFLQGGEGGARPDAAINLTLRYAVLFPAVVSDP